MPVKCYLEVDELPDTLYHATTKSSIESLKEGIILDKGRHAVDFGKGFYLTANYLQAVNLAGMKSRYAESIGNESLQGAIMSFKLNKDALTGLECLFLKEPDYEWANFIYANRSGGISEIHNQDQKYDFVYGPLADGRGIDLLIQDVQEGELSIEELWEQIISFKHPFPRDHQMSFHTSSAVNALSYGGVRYYEKRSLA
jgi:hypothetical protein